jgi:hydroxymethylglutaryl-CoA lyase
MRVPRGRPSAERSHDLGGRAAGWAAERARDRRVEPKLEFLDRLAGAGRRTLEATSFVHPKWVPQLADAGEPMGRLARRDGVA